MMRHRTSRQLDAAKAWNIENAYLACNPRTQAAAPEKRTPLQRYIHKLLFSCVQQQEVKVDKLVRHLRRLPWEECEREVLKCTLEVPLPPLLFVPPRLPVITKITCVVALLRYLFRSVETAPTTLYIASPPPTRAPRIAFLSVPLNLLHNDSIPRIAPLVH